MQCSRLDLCLAGYTGYLHSLNIQYNSSFGIVRKGPYLYIKSLVLEWRNKMLTAVGGIAFQWKSRRREYTFSNFGYK